MVEKHQEIVGMQPQSVYYLNISWTYRSLINIKGSFYNIETSQKSQCVHNISHQNPCNNNNNNNNHNNKNKYNNNNNWSARHCGQGSLKPLTHNTSKACGTCMLKIFSFFERKYQTLLLAYCLIRYCKVWIGIVFPRCIYLLSFIAKNII